MILILVHIIFQLKTGSLSSTLSLTSICFQNFCFDALSQYHSCSVTELSVLLSVVKLKFLTSSMIKVLFFTARNKFINLSLSN